MIQPAAFRRLDVMSLLLALLPSSVLADGAALTPAQIAERTIPSVALIRVPRGLGSGFAVANDRIATNLHVVSGATEATIVLQDGRELKSVEVMAVDVEHDLAVLRVGVHDLRAVTLGDSDQVKPGEHVVAIGHPLGLGDTVSDGLVSAVRQVSPTLRVLQISAPISHGSSGGPVVNDRGLVIGVSTAVFAEGQNINFAMPINQLKPLLSATHGTPIAEYHFPGVRQRRVPHHELSLLVGCSAGDLLAIAQQIGGAIESGAPVYNQGSVEGCFHIYAAAALEIGRAFPTCKGPPKALAQGMARADGVASFDDKAWAMRDAFDGVLDVIERAQVAPPPVAKSAALPAPPVRNVPHHPPSTLSHCGDAQQKRIQATLEGAVDAGAPLYNKGNFEACYRIYAGAALELGRPGSAGCAGVKSALGVGLRNAQAVESYVDKAWKMRDAFDGVLELLSRAQSGAP